MEREDLKEAINELYCFFQFKKSVDEDVVDIWLKKVKPIPVASIPWIIDRIQELESFPRNLPMSMWSFYSAFKRETGSGGEYDPVEDLRFPVGKMETAFRILEGSGETSFINYCNTHKMPSNDRERVLAKHRYCLDHQPLIDSVGHHANAEEGKERAPF
jgi:hypothetical protein